MERYKLYKRGISLMLVGGILVSTAANKYAYADTKSLFENIINIEKTGVFFTGNKSEDGGAAEIVKYNKDNNKFYVINGVKSKIHIVSLDEMQKGNNSSDSGKELDLRHLVEVGDFKYGDVTSIAIDNNRKEIAVSVQEKSYEKDGKVVIIDYDGNLKDIYSCGVQPDMITYTKDSKYILTANEGEPRLGYGEGIIDPEGSVTLINLENKTSKKVSFEKFNSSREELVSKNLLLKKGAKISEDLEPEYITVDSKSKTAYVGLQEANAIAVLDIEKGEFVSINPLGFKDHSIEKNAIDVVKDKNINIKTENLYGAYMPDSITSYDVNGKTYLLTANEGDAREYVTKDFPAILKGNQYSNIAKIKISGQSVEVLDNKVVDGLDENKNYLFGGRSFSIWDADTMKLVYDSGSDFEKIAAERYEEYFNTSNKNTAKEDRSGKKGPEPEEVRVGLVGDKVMAFIGLERIGGVMTYDITSNNNVKFQSYLNTRDFSEDIGGDSGPEGIEFIPANISKSGYPMLLVANEISGTVSSLEIKAGYEKPENVINKEAADKVINEISKLNVEITLNNKDMILKARLSYNSLTDAQKLLVNNLDILVKSEERLAYLEDEAKLEEVDRQASQSVIDIINNLPNTISAQDKDKIKRAREEYNLLNEKQKAKVNNLDKLFAAENKLVELEKIENAKKEEKQNSDKVNTNKPNGNLPHTGGVGAAGILALAGASITAGRKLFKNKK